VYRLQEAAAQSWVDLCARLSARFKRQALRPLQLKYLLKIEAAWKHMKSTGVYKPIVLIAPTGFGKSFIMGALNFVAVPDGPVLHLCHWQVLNHSNASFFLDREKLSDFFEERRDQGNLGREVHINTAKETKGSCYGGTTFAENVRKGNPAYMFPSYRFEVFGGPDGQKSQEGTANGLHPSVSRRRIPTFHARQRL